MRFNSPIKARNERPIADRKLFVFSPVFGRVLDTFFTALSFEFVICFSSLIVGIVVSLDLFEIVVKSLLTFNVGNSVTEGA